MVKGTPLPAELQHAALIVESGCAITLDDLENMPADLLSQVMVYRTVKAVKESGD